MTAVVLALETPDLEHAIAQNIADAVDSCDGSMPWTGISSFIERSFDSPLDLASPLRPALDLLRLGQDQHRRRRGVDAPLALGDRHALHAVRPTLVLEAGPGSLAGDDDPLTDDD